MFCKCMHPRRLKLLSSVTVYRAGHVLLVIHYAGMRMSVLTATTPLASACFFPSGLSHSLLGWQCKTGFISPCGPFGNIFCYHWPSFECTGTCELLLFLSTATTVLPTFFHLLWTGFVVTLSYCHYYSVSQHAFVQQPAIFKKKINKPGLCSLAVVVLLCTGIL